MARILLLYDSRGGLTEQLADEIERGVIDAGVVCVRKRVEDAAPQDMLDADGMIVDYPFVFAPSEPSSR